MTEVRRALLLSLAVLCGCPNNDRPPGDEAMGVYNLRAEPVSLTCGLPRIPNNFPANGFDFSGTLSRFRDGGAVFLTLDGISRDAGFDGQIAYSTHSAPRTFTLPDGGNCAPTPMECEMRVVETIVVALLSKSQSAALGDKCPANALDGGLPGPDAGASLPGSAATGFDSVRACGDLYEQIVGIGNCDPLCACLLKFRLAGDRK